MANVGRMVKEASVTEFTNRLAQQPNFFVTSINRLPASDADSLRMKLHGAQGRLILMKRRLGRRALQGLQLDGVEALLQGSVAFVLSGDDVLQTAKLLVEFHKAHEEQLAVQGAVIDGQLFDQRRVKELASLPPKPVLLAHVIGTVESPIASVIMTVERLIGDLIRGLDQLATKRAAEPQPHAAAQAPAAAQGSAPAAPSTPAPDAGAPPGAAGGVAPIH